VNRKIRSYESGELVVHYDVKRCIHAEECVHGLPSVFDPVRRPWIDPEAADAASVVEVVERCPTGALRYEWKSGGRQEKAAVPSVIRVSENGPLYIRGDVSIESGVDDESLRENRVALCRCGRSKDKPFCDNSHMSAEFVDGGRIAGEPAVRDEQAPHALSLKPIPNGPVLVRGRYVLEEADGTRIEGEGGALCRCGHSASKPFCDGAHKQIGFSTEPGSDEADPQVGGGR
jgi:CDGSH-type Zn-finger protein/uncharacterized Fe-S cluster protein YjdI